MRSPVCAQHIERRCGQRDVAVASAFAVDVQHAARAVHVGHLQGCALQQAQAADVDRRQTGPIDRQPYRAENALHLRSTQDHRQLLLAPGPDQVEQLPVALQRPFIEELDPAQRDRETRRREVLDVGQVEEILAKILLPEVSGRSVEVGCKMVDGAHVGLLRALGEPTKLHVIEHPLAQWRHGIPFPSGRHRPEENAT